MLFCFTVFLLTLKSEIRVELIWTPTHTYELVVQSPLFRKASRWHHSLGSPVPCWSARLALGNGVSECVLVCFCGLSSDSGSFTYPVPALCFERGVVWLLAIWWGQSPHLLVFSRVLAILGALLSWNRRNVFSKCAFKELTEFIIRQGR